MFAKLTGAELGSDSGLKFKVVEELGNGKQGAVFKVKSNDGRELALKLYHDHICSSQHVKSLKNSLRELVKRGAPSTHFVWPIDTVSDFDSGRFGYLMEVIGDQYCSSSTFFNRDKTATLRRMLMIAYDLVFSFDKLHALGLCYQDISDNNVLVDTERGRVLIVDNDNVRVNGEACGSMHTPPYAAKEIVFGNQPPNSDSDIHSAAILLFKILLNHHPFKGRIEWRYFCPSTEDEYEIYVRNPIYIFHPSDQTNRPVPEEHDDVILLWQKKVYPPELMGLFETAFTVGVTQPKKRVRLTQWQSVILELLDRLVICRSCRSHAFLGQDLAQTECWQCGASLPEGPTISWHDGRNVRRMVISCDSEIYQFQLDAGSRSPRILSSPILKAVEHPANPEKLGLKNLTGGTIKVRTPDAQIFDVKNECNILLRPGASIFIGNKELAVAEQHVLLSQ